MSRSYFMGIDIGTFETKGVILDDKFDAVAKYAVPHGMDNPAPNQYEHDAESVWWHDICAVSKGLIEKSGIDPAEIKAMGASALGCDCLPVDKNCKPLRKAILYGVDARASKEIEYLHNLYGEEGVERLFGRFLCSDDIGPKILWIKNNEPEVYEKTHKFLTGSSFVVAKLTGEYTIDRFLATSSFMPMYRPDGSIDPEMCDPICAPEQLARAGTVTDIAGYVTAQAAKETGLKEGTPVIIGTGDSTTEAISAGLVEPGNLLFQFGSSLFFYYCTDHLVGGKGIQHSRFTVPGTYCLGGGTNAAGTLTRWVRDNFYFDYVEEERNGGKNAYDRMAEDADNIPAGSDGLIMLPYILGERMPINDPQAKGVLFGLKGTHTRHHIIRAAMEAIGFTIDQLKSYFESLDLKVDALMAVGGGTKSIPWMQIVADILGVPVEIAEGDRSACYGDAMMAAIGIGVLKDFAALKAAIKPGMIIEPNMANHEIYKPLRKLYDELYLTNKEFMHML